MAVIPTHLWLVCLCAQFKDAEEDNARQFKRREDQLVTKMQAETFDLRQEVRILKEHLKNQKHMSHAAASDMAGGTEVDAEELASEVQSLTAQVQNPTHPNPTQSQRTRNTTIQPSYPIHACGRVSILTEILSH